MEREEPAPVGMMNVDSNCGVLVRERGAIRVNCPICASMSTPGDVHPEVELFRCARCGHRFSRLRSGVSMERYDAVYYQETHRNWFANPNLSLFERIARLIDHELEPRSLIDVGCGNGNFLRFLAARSASPVALTGVDLRANAPTPGIEFIQGDALSRDLGRQFSIVVSLATIEHLLDARAFVRRLRSLAKPGGLVVVMALNDDSVLYMAARLLRRIGMVLPFHRLYGRHHMHHFSRISLSCLLESEGLKPERVILHNAPLASIDIPLSGPTAALLRVCVSTLFAVGSLSGRTYLQTAICRRPYS